MISIKDKGRELQMINYVIISPVRNEEKFLKLTVDSMASQTLLPKEWIMVNDGSTDRTEELIKEYTIQYPWIKLITLTDRGYYFPGTGVVNVFNKGFEQISFKGWDYLVKLDVDLSFEKTYFEALFKRFTDNPKLGIASGCTFIPVNNSWVQEFDQKDHPVGASKVYRRGCWDQMGGLKPVPGWDLADLLSAQMHGWETALFTDLKINHYRPTGSRREGIWAPKFLQGRFEYKHGYTFGYTFLKAFYNLFARPPIIGSIAKVCGFLYAYIKKEDYLFEKDMRLFLRKKHGHLLRGRFQHMFNK
jgi:poly-beta-1,6-N-acetyl-D-glucosamine synthase